MTILPVARFIGGALLTLLVLPGLGATEDQPLPKSPNMLFWSQQQRDDFFPHMEKVFSTHEVRHGNHVRALPEGLPLGSGPHGAGIDEKLQHYMAAEHTAGIVVVQEGRVRYEHYGLGFSDAGRWTSFSVAKSFTSTLVGAAIKDGYIGSIDDPVVKYLPDLKDSAYEGVSIRQLLTMTSGVKWNEDYTDPKSDVALFAYAPADPGVDQTVSYMRKLPREAAPGSKWVYKTGETNLVGVLVTHATHKTLSQYLSEKIWIPYGMQQDAVWMTSKDSGQEQGGCCISAALRDFARFGMFVLDHGNIDGSSVVPDGWFEQATTTQIATEAPGQGYGFQWWTNADGTVDARGIFGQLIHIDPKRKLVVAMSSSWPTAVGDARIAARSAMIKAISAAAD